MHEKKMSTGVLRIRMNTCTIIGLIILPFLLFMLYVVLFSECTYLLRNSGWRNISPKFINFKENEIKKGEDESDDGSLSVDIYKEFGLNNEDGPLELINKVQLKGDKEDNDLPLGKSSFDKSSGEILVNLPPVSGVMRIVILTDDLSSSSDNGDYIVHQKIISQDLDNKNINEGYDHEELDSNLPHNFYPLFIFPREEIQKNDSSQIKSATPSTSLDESKEAEKYEKEKANTENNSDEIIGDNKSNVKTEIQQKSAESSSKSKDSVDLFTVHKEDDNFHRMFYEFMDFSIPNMLICPEDGKNMNLLIGIQSDVENFEQRKAIRDTWAKVAQIEGVNYAFIVGIGASDSLDNKLKHESDEFQDIIQTDILSRKKYRDANPVMFLKWIKTYCPHVKHAIKADDNIFLNIPQILKFIKDGAIKDDTIYGDIFIDEIPDRDETSENYVPKELFQEDFYPLYLNRAGYLFPGKFAGPLFDEAAKMPYFPKENILITGILSNKLDINREDASDYFIKYSEVEKQEEKCSFLNYSIVYPVTTDQMRSLWDEIKSTDFKCFNFLGNLLSTIDTKTGNEDVYEQQEKLFNLLNGNKIIRKIDEKSLLG